MNVNKVTPTTRPEFIILAKGKKKKEGWKEKYCQESFTSRRNSQSSLDVALLLGFKIALGTNLEKTETLKAKITNELTLEYLMTVHMYG